MSITVKGLTKLYGTQKAINNLSFEIKQGEIVGFLGPNGAGKSTTMKIITGYLQQDSGLVDVCGISVKDNPLLTKNKIGYLPEANPLYFDMYIKEYLTFIAGVHKIKSVSAAIDEVIALTGLTVERNKKIGQLSKGYKQRVGLAAALIHEPEVLILDEPTTGLDPNQIIEIRNVIKQQGANKTVLFSSHILQEVEAICDRVIIINKGEIVADDVLTNLTKSSKRNTILLELQEVVDASIFASFDVRKIQPTQWQFTTNNIEVTRKVLMELIVQNALTIVSLSNKSNDNLEDVFRNLTTKK